MTWTKKKPTKAGWYWVRAKGYRPRVLRFVRFYGTWGGYYDYEPDGLRWKADWEWFAFIPEPRGKAKR